MHSFFHAENFNFFFMRDKNADAQADLCLRWAHISKGTFSQVVTHMSMYTEKRRPPDCGLDFRCSH